MNKGIIGPFYLWVKGKEKPRRVQWSDVWNQQRINKTKSRKPPSCDISNLICIYPWLRIAASNRNFRKCNISYKVEFEFQPFTPNPYLHSLSTEEVLSVFISWDRLSKNSITASTGYAIFRPILIRPLIPTPLESRFAQYLSVMIPPVNLVYLMLDFYVN